MENSPTLVKKIMQGTDLVFKDGNVIIWGIPTQLFPVNTVVLLQKMMELSYGYSDVSNLLYQLGRIQGKRGGEMMFKRFGFKKTKKSSELAAQQGELIGIGKQEYIKFELKNNHFIVKNLATPMAKVYLNIYGKQKFPECHFVRGARTGAHEALMGTDLIGIETQCISMGKPYCVFEIKETKKWDQSLELIRNQFPLSTTIPDHIESFETLKTLLRTKSMI